MNLIDTSKIEIIRHDEEMNLDSFSCGDKDLDEFLKKDSLKQKELMLNNTFIATYKYEVIGFFTISADVIKIKKLGKSYKEKFQEKSNVYKVYPALKIGRIGVKSDFRGNKIGTFLLKWIFNKSIKEWSEIGFRFITIDSYVSAYKSYEKKGCRLTLDQSEFKKKIKKIRKS